ncbi:hypothetical protein SEA_ZUCKER_90 [Arthrobacter phage Zucker]|nr:hypothetical protein SEA_ZUCKER_90 [Arthrobacter phage Zucker]
MSNTHFATAKFRQEGVHEWQGEEGSTEATNLSAALDAQTEAALALAYEHRTANLIALHAALRERRDNRQALELLNVIKERLDIE